METTIKVQLTLVYSDATTRNLTFNGVEEEAIPDVKEKVQAINANMPAVVAATFVSANGAPVTMIRSAKIITTQEEVIYRAS